MSKAVSSLRGVTERNSLSEPTYKEYPTLPKAKRELEFLRNLSNAVFALKDADETSLADAFEYIKSRCRDSKEFETRNEYRAMLDAANAINKTIGK